MSSKKTTGGKDESNIVFVRNFVTEITTWNSEGKGT